VDSPDICIEYCLKTLELRCLFRGILVNQSLTCIIYIQKSCQTLNYPLLPMYYRHMSMMKESTVLHLIFFIGFDTDDVVIVFYLFYLFIIEEVEGGR
jgi:hypothetical protein